MMMPVSTASNPPPTSSNRARPPRREGVLTRVTAKRVVRSLGCERSLVPAQSFAHVTLGDPLRRRCLFVGSLPSEAFATGGWGTRGGPRL
jgi:hypothetical protein